MNFLFILTLVLSPVSVFGMKCPTGTYHVRSYHRRAYTRADGVLVSATQVRESCHSKNAIYDRWYPLLKDGRPSGWQNPSESGKKWADEERDRILEALGQLPDEILKSPIQGLYRLSRSVYYPNPASLLGGSVALYDTAFDKDRNLARILAHELSHSLFNRLTSADRRSYREVMGWTEYEAGPQDGVVTWKESPGQFVEEDGRQGPGEDYANNVEFYLFEPNVLKSTSPRAFE